MLWSHDIKTEKNIQHWLLLYKGKIYLDKAFLFPAGLKVGFVNHPLARRNTRQKLLIPCGFFYEKKSNRESD